MAQTYVGLTLVVFLSCNILFCHADFYWRQFAKDIPEDAIIGGKDINHKNLYIGRAYLKNGGVVPIEIKEGQTEFYIIWYGLPKTTQFVEILCGSQDDFRWVSVNSKSFHIVMLDHKPVIGGYHDGQGLTNVGRINFNGETKIGKIDSWQLGNAVFYCVDKPTVKSANNYEVMVYEKKPDFDVRIYDNEKMSTSQEGYYWRQFSEDIPEDAVVGGRDINNKNIYIGRAYLRGGGVIPVEIKEGQKPIYIIWYGLPTTTHFVEILCGSQDNFTWKLANNTHFHSILSQEEPVIGGYHDGQGFTNIGRIHLSGETKVGKIDSFSKNNAIFYCVDRAAVKSALSYEVMLYEKNSVSDKK